MTRALNERSTARRALWPTSRAQVVVAGRFRETPAQPHGIPWRDDEGGLVVVDVVRQSRRPGHHDGAGHRHRLQQDALAAGVEQGLGRDGHDAGPAEQVSVDGPVDIAQHLDTGRHALTRDITWPATQLHRQVDPLEGREQRGPVPAAVAADHQDVVAVGLPGWGERLVVDPERDVTETVGAEP